MRDYSSDLTLQEVCEALDAETIWNMAVESYQQANVRGELCCSSVLVSMRSNL